MLDPIEQFLATYPPGMQDISRTLGAMVRGAMPQAIEILYASQNHFAYALSESSRDRIVYICPMKDYVRLGFMFGGSLPDPDHVLEGTGKRLRHVKVRSAQYAGNPALRRLVEVAWADAIPRMKKPLPNQRKAMGNE